MFRMGMTMVLEGDKTMWPDVPNDKQWYTLVQSCTMLKGVSLSQCSEQQTIGTLFMARCSRYNVM
jgi:hypothetical protein